MSGNSSKKISDWLVDYGLPLAAWTSAVIVVISLVLWLIVALGLDPMFSQQKPAVVLDEAGVYVTVEMETAVAADGRPIKLAFAIHNQSAITQTVSLTATMTSEHLLFTTPPRLSDITVSPQTMVTQTIAVANSSPANGLRVSEMLSVTAVLAAGQPDGVPVPLTIYSEGTWGRGLRQLVNSTVQQASPLIIVIAFLVPGFIQLVQHYIKQKREERVKEQAQQEKEQAKQQQQQQEEQDKQIDGWLKGLRNAILSENLEQANTLLTQLTTIDNTFAKNSVN